MNEHLTDERLAGLRTIAEADVSPSPWRVALDAPCFLSVASTEGWDVAACGDEVTKHSSEDAHFIAAFDPPTVLALLAEVERLRAATEQPHRRLRSCHERGSAVEEPEFTLKTSGWGAVIDFGNYELPAEMHARLIGEHYEAVFVFRVLETLEVVCTNLEIKSADLKRRHVAAISIDDVKEAAIREQARHRNGDQAGREAVRAVHRARKPVDPAVLRRVAEILELHPKTAGDNDRALASPDAYQLITQELGASLRTAQRYVRDVLEAGVEAPQAMTKFIFRGEPMTMDEVDDDVRLSPL